MRTFGVEEEFMFVDSATLHPLPVSTQVQSLLRSRSSTAAPAPTPPTAHVDHAPFVHSEFLASQIEHSSPVFDRLDQAEASLLGFRSRLAEAATALNSVAVGVGAPFQTDGWPEVTISARYRRVEEEFRGLIPDHLINGLHLHVGIPSQEAGVEALNRLRVWLPVLLAMSSNSPFWNGRDTGFSSWRSIHARRWSTGGCPPYFADVADYHRRTQRLVGVAGTFDLHTIWWGARLAEKYPTVEVRVCDAQLDTPSTLLLAALTRALVSTALIAAERGRCPVFLEPELLDASLWHAAREGVQARLINPLSGELAPARAVVRALVTSVTDALEESGDAEQVSHLLDRFWRLGTGADRQRYALSSGGTDSLGTLLRTTLNACD
ncbi:YbdK family carboxylate-amine ligase [Cryobacterium sp. CG_9.6]|uniref:carboxylate-amine ligase n=1 Tax=Cryobacterium sp. CG_9.6 TaxID=2760710 RepID=UPI002475F8EC|nr:YbdK family carboxylate-amine ligase [Cryobacterium sp. CG_9.6]